MDYDETDIVSSVPIDFTNKYETLVYCTYKDERWIKKYLSTDTNYAVDKYRRHKFKRVIWRY